MPKRDRRMTAMPDVLERARDTLDRESDRTVHMLQALREGVHNLTIEDYEQWKSYLNRLIETSEAAMRTRTADTLGAFAQVLEEGYRLMLLYRSAAREEQTVVRTKEEWEALPDRGFEDGFQRYGIK